MKIRRWNPLDWFLGDWIRSIPAGRRLRFARRLGVVKWTVIAAMACLVAWQEFGDRAASSSVPPRMEMTVAEASQASALAASIKRTWDIEVRYQGDTSTFYLPLPHIPDAWKLEPVAAPDIVPGLKAISTALSAYPQSYVKAASSQVGIIYLCRKISINGLEFGGMFSAGAIYVPAIDMDDAYEVTFAQDAVHHEFALTGLYGGQSPQDAWRAVNPPGFAYRGDTDKSIVDTAEHRADANDATDDVHEAGFIFEYAKASLVEDWQTYAEQAFGHPEGLIGLVKRFPRVKAKAKIFVDHYEMLDPAFGAYFERTGLKDASR